MKAETQSASLMKMMQKYAHCPKYSLTFPELSIQRKAIKKLKRGQVLLLGLQRLELYLQNAEQRAEVRLLQSGKTFKIEILNNNSTEPHKSESKKIVNLSVQLSSFHVKNLEAGNIVEIPPLDYAKVSLYADGEKVAKGALVTVDDAIALEVKEVCHA